MNELGPSTSEQELASHFSDATRRKFGAGKLIAALTPEQREHLVYWALENSRSEASFFAPFFSELQDVGVDVSAAAGARLQHGPLLDALACLPFAALLWEDPDHDALRARVDLLTWEAGAGAIVLPALGRWLSDNGEAYNRLVEDRCHGNLRGRVLAARLLAVAAAGMGTSLAHDKVIFLASHPSPLVWVPALRAMGRMADRAPALRRILRDWQEGTVPWKKRRSAAALACTADQDTLAELWPTLVGTDDPWQTAAFAVGVPYIVREHHGQWPAIEAALLSHHEHPQVLWSMKQGLLALGRHDAPSRDLTMALTDIRRLAIEAGDAATTDHQLWSAIRRHTDFLEDIEFDPTFPASTLDRYVQGAVNRSPGQFAERALAVARSIPGQYEFCLKRLGTEMSAEQRGRSLETLESCSEAAALALWEPIARAAQMDDSCEALAQELNAMTERLPERINEVSTHFADRRTLMRCIGHSIDTCAMDNQELASRRAGAALMSLSRGAWATDSKARDLRKFRRPVADLLRRIADPLSRNLEPQLALEAISIWWAVFMGPTPLLQVLANDEESIRNALSRLQALEDIESMPLPAWSTAMGSIVNARGTRGTTLDVALHNLIGALLSIDSHKSPSFDGITHLLEHLAESTVILQECSEHPSLALSSDLEYSHIRRLSQELLDRTQEQAQGKTEADQIVAAWTKGLGPLLSPTVEELIRRLVVSERTKDFAASSKVIGPYTKIRQLGAGGGGELWLVRREKRQRCVLKIPSGLHDISSEDKLALIASLDNEASILQELHVANVATYLDHGTHKGITYLVIEYLIGADLDQYLAVRPLGLAELKPIILDVCTGLQGLHQNGVLHLDLKPANVFLRMQLPTEAKEVFAPEHRATSSAPITQAVLIDFGISRVLSHHAKTERVAGTAGFIAPEQVRRDALTPNTDVYSLAATIFTALTGEVFFGDCKTWEQQREAHQSTPPFDTKWVQRAAQKLPEPLTELLIEATGLNAGRRPEVAAFRERFESIG